jgi:YegS/Rv2252/BmrU family lipid kinase
MAARRETFIKHFQDRSWEYEVYETSKDDDLAKVVKDAIDRGFEIMIACGGDGTVAGVASGVAETNIPMAILPAGTGNMLARDLGIPLKFESALEIITNQHEIMHMDAIRVKEQIYLLNLGVGLSSGVMERTEREQKRKFGMLAYAWSAVKELVGLKRRSYQVQVDDQVSMIRASEVLVVNSSFIGIHSFPKTLAFRPDDGMLDVVIVRARTLIDLATLLIGVLLGRKAPSSKFLSYKAYDKIVIHADRRLTVQADGEVIGQTPLEVKILPGALRVIVPPDGPFTWSEDFKAVEEKVEEENSKEGE